MHPDWIKIHNLILVLEQKGLTTRTFRRLDAQRQQTVINAILDEAAEKGPTMLNITQVAARAGISVGSLYQYFNDRQGLVSFAVELCTALLTDAFAEVRTYLAEMPLRDGLLAYIMGGLEWSQTQVGLMQFVGRAAYQGDPQFAVSVVQPIADAMRAVVLDMLQSARERGEIRPEIDLDAMARLVHAMTIAVIDPLLFPYLNVYFQVTTEDMPTERIVLVLIDLIMKGIAP
jgi:AcrR family transcriptional regulator